MGKDMETTFVVDKACSVFLAPIVRMQEVDGAIIPVVESAQSAAQNITLTYASGVVIKSQLWQFSASVYQRLSAIVETLNDQVEVGFVYYLKCDIPFVVAEEYSALELWTQFLTWVA